MKKMYVLLFVLMSFVEAGISQNQAIFNDMVTSGYKAPGGNYDKVKVIISVKEGESIRDAMAEVKEHMHMKDPWGFINPYWITKFPDEAFWGNDAVIIGTWFQDDLYGWSTWIAKMKVKLQEMPSLASYKVYNLR